MAIIRYTTPTLKFTFSEVEVADIAAAFLIVKQGGKTIIERDIETAVVTNTQTEKSLAWKLTQDETKKLSKTQATIYCDWKLNDGTRGRSHVKTEQIEDTGKQEVI